MRAAGRPRRYESADELRILLDSALAVMQRNGYADAAVAHILREADLSTRSFYRHFESKDQLLCALCRREAEQAAARLSANVGAAGNPLSALHAWIDEILGLEVPVEGAGRQVGLPQDVGHRCVRVAVALHDGEGRIEEDAQFVGALVTAWPPRRPHGRLGHGCPTGTWRGRGPRRGRGARR